MGRRHQARDWFVNPPGSRAAAIAAAEVVAERADQAIARRCGWPWLKLPRPLAHQATQRRVDRLRSIRSRGEGSRIQGAGSATAAGWAEG